MGVFKVETVGDCYVAVTGIPKPRKDHAVLMARFAKRVIDTFNATVKKLEVSLGPDTGDLCIRVGMHSGPITAGVLRGERSRFQLFGDTMNTASRMESTSSMNRIQASSATAALIAQGGKERWVKLRKDQVEIKGKGLMTTYWIKPTRKATDTSETTGGTPEEDEGTLEQKRFERNQRLIDWNVETLSRSIELIVAARRTTSGGNEKDVGLDAAATLDAHEGSFLEEVKEIIPLRSYRNDKAPNWRIETMEEEPLADEVVEQLREYVTCIANMYQNNPFHNFEHASHVTMSVNKLLARIVAPTGNLQLRSSQSNTSLEDLSTDLASSALLLSDNISKVEAPNPGASLHDHTYGITADPLIQFACSFSALIHDVDHPGIPNSQLIVENPALGRLYQNRSVAEQNSLTLSWNLLMDSCFDDLRRTVCPTADELARFRALVVNSVMATDIVDSDLKELRNNRWEKAFTGSGSDRSVSSFNVEESSEDVINRKATIVIEHLIQASDVSHTMQHWHVYRKWNKRLFNEMYEAFQTGRTQSNPADFWAKGEIGFFDFYVIPLAKKLKECGVFGVSSDEFLTYAVTNRDEWEARGEAVVAELIQQYESCHPSKAV